MDITLIRRNVPFHVTLPEFLTHTTKRDFEVLCFTIPRIASDRSSVRFAKCHGFIPRDFRTGDRTMGKPDSGDAFVHLLTSTSFLHKKCSSRMPRRTAIVRCWLISPRTSNGPGGLLPEGQPMEPPRNSRRAPLITGQPIKSVPNSDESGAIRCRHGVSSWSVIPRNAEILVPVGLP